MNETRPEGPASTDGDVLPWFHGMQATRVYLLWALVVICLENAQEQRALGPAKLLLFQEERRALPPPFPWNISNATHDDGGREQSPACPISGLNRQVSPNSVPQRPIDVGGLVSPQGCGKVLNEAIQQRVFQSCFGHSS